MPPLILTEERRGIPYHQIPVVPRQLNKGDISLLSLSKREQLCRRKSLNKDLEQRRKVKFSVVKTALLEDTLPASEMLDDEKEVLWWNRDELNESVKSIGKIMGAMSKGPRSAQPYHSLLYRIEDSCHEGPAAQEDIHALADWHRKSLSKRGLERLVLNSNEHNSKIRETIIHASSLVRGNSNIEEDLQAESLRVCSERLTSSARLVARAIAEADALCLVPAPSKRRSRRASDML